MARPSDEFVLAWSSLSCEDTANGWQVISLSAAGPVEVQAGRRSPSNAEAVLLSFPTARLARAEKLPEGRGFVVENINSTDDEELKLALTRQTEGSIELFTAMACDVVGALDVAALSGTAESKLLRIFVGRVNAWQQFMSHGKVPLSLEAELGLAGELYFIKLLLDSGVSPELIINAWVGPEDAPQDFLLGYGAIEVKATMSTSGFSVKIGSLEQLDDSIASPLFLAAIKFVGVDSGFTLPEMVTNLEHSLGEDPNVIRLFRERLLSVGYSEIHTNQYTRKFEQKEKRIFSVTEGFPRLTSGSAPAGVTHAKYEINLDHAENFLIDLNKALNNLGVIG